MIEPVKTKEEYLNEYLHNVTLCVDKAGRVIFKHNGEKIMCLNRKILTVDYFSVWNALAWDYDMGDKEKTEGFIKDQIQKNFNFKLKQVEVTYRPDFFNV